MSLKCLRFFIFFFNVSHPALLPSFVSAWDPRVHDTLR